MPEGQGTYSEEDDDKSFTQITVKDLKNLRQAFKERNDLATKTSQYERELAFAKAKLDLEDPKIGYFMKGYDGDLTPDAIRERAEADGFLTPPPTNQNQSDNRGDMQAQQRIARASAGAGETSLPDLAELIAQANSPEEVMKLVQSAGDIPTSWDN